MSQMQYLTPDNWGGLLPHQEVWTSTSVPGHTSHHRKEPIRREGWL